MITLVANTGIQLWKTKVVVDLNEFKERMYFHEFFDISTYKLSLQLAHKFANDDIYVNKFDLRDGGFMYKGEVNVKWESLSKTDKDNIEKFDENEIITCSVQSLLKGNDNILGKFMNQWLPLPFFEKNSADVITEGPYNWARIKIIPSGQMINNKQEWNVIVAFDTKSIYDEGNYNDEYKETPVFSNEFETCKKFGMSDNDFYNFSFSSSEHTSWIDNYILRLVHSTTNINNVKSDKKYTYLASYMYFLKLLRNVIEFEDVILYRDINVEETDVKMVVDMGNSKTTVVLFEGDDSTKIDKAELLELQNFTNLSLSYKDPFDMQIAFQMANFGNIGLGNSKQFIYPSFIRVGNEAKYLIYNANNSYDNSAAHTTCSSPKRYLWDSKPTKYEWECVNLSENNEHNPIWIPGISEQLNSDGSLNLDGLSGNMANFSRQSLMTFVFLEIYAQAGMQMNSHKFRSNCIAGPVSQKRKISKIIITCPTAMSRLEQIALRQAAETAYIIFKRFCTNSYMDAASIDAIKKEIEIVPSITNLKNKEERVEWIYDEAMCPQIVYLCAEVAERYKKNCSEFFDVYGKVRNDLENYNQKSLTIGSLDIGAGTTDLMICSYKYQESGQVILTPVPLFWESFYVAGDDMLNKFVQNIIIEGPQALISNKLKKLGKTDRTILLAKFFGTDNAKIDSNSRKRRSDFNLQISVPIALAFIEEARKQTKTKTFVWTDFFDSDNMPNSKLLDEFYNHFGFRIEDEEWNFDISYVNQLISSTFDKLLRKISAAMSCYKCDIVLLSGRPTSLKQIEDIFLKYYPVSPNRLKVLNEYRVGRWYPFQDGDGYFDNQKTIVVTGALLGYMASEQGGFDNLSFDFKELIEKEIPTTNYFGVIDSSTRIMEEQNVLITPQKNSSNFVCSMLPLSIGCRQLNTSSYPSRLFYKFDFDDDRICQTLKDKGVQEADINEKLKEERQKITKKMPLTISISRNDYLNDKETLEIDGIYDREGEELPLKYFKLQVQSLNEYDDYWLDSGVFNLSITTRNND